MENIHPDAVLMAYDTDGPVQAVFSYLIILLLVSIELTNIGTSLIVQYKIFRGRNNIARSTYKMQQGLTILQIFQVFFL